jgi:hypothetical protein
MTSGARIACSDESGCRVNVTSTLEHDIGGPLLERAECGRPMRPTPLAEQVLAALQRSGQTRGRPGLT